MTINFSKVSPQEPRSRPQLTQSGVNTPSSDLRDHPKWTEFVFRLGQRILSRHPDLRAVYLELLDEIDGPTEPHYT